MKGIYVSFSFTTLSGQHSKYNEMKLGTRFGLGRGSLKVPSDGGGISCHIKIVKTISHSQLEALGKNDLDDSDSENHVVEDRKSSAFSSEKESESENDDASQISDLNDDSTLLLQTKLMLPHSTDEIGKFNQI